MKSITVVMAMTLAGSLVWSGCGKKEEAPPSAQPIAAPAAEVPAVKAPPVPAPVAEAPKAPANVVDLLVSAKDGVDKAMAMAKAGKYTEALSWLQQKAAEVQSNPEAKKLIDDAIAQIKKMATEAATKAATDKVGGMLGGLGK